MSRKTLLTLTIPVLLCALFIGLWSLTRYYADLPSHLSQHETIILGQNRYVPGSQVALRVVVRDSKDASPLPGASVMVSLKPVKGKSAVQLFSGITDSQGNANVAFQVPADLPPDQTLLIETKSSLGSDIVERPVTLVRDYRILLTTDKPIYQPGQVINVRALALSTFDLTPAQAQQLEITIADGKGNKVFRKALSTSDFGVVATDFHLADQVNTGSYKITASLGETTSESTVTVEHYVLPKFKIAISTARNYYLPGQHVSGSLQADYFFGKPLAEAQVVLEGYTFDVQKNSILTLQGTTNTQGSYNFEFDLPAYLAGTELEGGRARFYLQASLTDQALHTETSNLSLPIAAQALVVAAIPEGGQFRPGVDNILYVLTSYPDGRPAETSLTVNFYSGEPSITTETGSYGLAEVHFTPNDPYQQLRIEARDNQGNVTTQEFSFSGEYSLETVLLRPDKPVYQVGQSMNLVILTSQSQGTVYLDVIREGQTVSTRAIEISNGRAEIAIDLTPDLYGTLELHAYKILTSGSITRDTRLVVVNNANDLVVNIDPLHRADWGDQYYRPGDTSPLDIQVNGLNGNGIASALGLAIVDESVFALAEQDPGFAKLYFLLENEILQPRYDLHGFSIPDLMYGIPSNDPLLKTAIANTAQASLAAATPQQVNFTLQANSHQDAIQRTAQSQVKFFTKLSKVLYGGVLAIPLVILGLSVFSIYRQKRLGNSLALFFGCLLLVVLLFFLWPLSENNRWVQTPFDRLGLLLTWVSTAGQLYLVLVSLLAVIGFITLVVFALRRKDGPLGWSLLLVPVFMLGVGFLVYALLQTPINPKTAVLVWGLVAFLGLPLAFFLRATGFTWEKQSIPALASLTIAVFLIMGTFPILALSGSAKASRQPAFEGDFLQGAGGRVEEALPGLRVGMAPEPTAAPVFVKGEVDKTIETQSSGTTPPRLRQFFPETMLWIPDAVTDINGFYHVDVPVADSITTWRVTALASTQDGRLGSTTAALRVFQDFFIDLDLPQALTVGDEVSIPVGVFNYLPESQLVKLELEVVGETNSASWFELKDDPIKEITIASNDISVVYFRIKATRFGRYPFKVTAWGSKMSDAIQKDVQVYPDGKPITTSQSDRLAAGVPVRQPVLIPSDAIPGTQSLVVKIYPGMISQVVEGLDSILRMPNGCFEQTSSSTYPNVLVLDYLKASNQASPEVQMKAEEYINLGYQRLTTFEVASTGGFSLFGEPPADRMLTAYGLQEFADMSRVHDVDPALIKRAAEWLLAQQTGDGSWENDRGLVHENTWSSLGNDRLPVTAYIVWSLVDAGFVDDPRTQKGLQFIREFQSQADDPYELGLVANALVAADLKKGEKITATTTAVLDRLAGQANNTANRVSWTSKIATFMGSEGNTGSIETTALAALAFLRSTTHPDLANAALTYLIQQKDNFGSWYTTQATVLSLKALIQSLRAGAEKVNATVTLTLNGSQTRTIQVSPENFDVVQLVSFEDVNPGKDNTVEITMQGEGNLMYQVSASYYLPWSKLVEYPDLVPPAELLLIAVQYDRTELTVNDKVKVSVTASLNQGKADSALIDLGLPPGFTVMTEDLDALIAYYSDQLADYPGPKIARYELTGRQILIYVTNLSGDYPLQFSYYLRAKFPMQAQAPASNAYDYYNPDIAGESIPQTLVVNP